MKGTNKKTCKNIKGSLKLTTLGFTLVELLAVIVILAIILVIAVPKVMSVIEDAKKATLESTAKIIANQAEKQKIQNTVLGKNEKITCESITKLNKGDYSSCSITFEDNTAKVTIEGSGKFDGLWVCNGTKTSAEAQKGVCVEPFQVKHPLFLKGEPLTPDKFDVNLVEDDGSIRKLWGGGIKVDETVEATTITSPNWPNNYPDNMTEEENYWEVTYEGAEAMQITFDVSSKLSEYYNNVIYTANIDYLYIYDKTGTQVYRFTNDAIDGFTYIVTGDYVKITMESDDKYTEKGFRATIKPLKNFASEYIVSPSIVPNTNENFDITITMDEQNISKKISTKAVHNVEDYITALEPFEKLLEQTSVEYQGTTYDAGIRYISQKNEYNEYNINNKVYYNCDDIDVNGVEYGEIDYDYANSCEVWRMIGVFDTKTSEAGSAVSRVKIINTNSTFTVGWDSSDDGSIEGKPEVNHGQGINQWGESTYEDGTFYEGADLMRLLNGYYIGKEGATCTYYTYDNYGNDKEMTCDTEDNRLKDKNMKVLTTMAKEMIENAVWDTYVVKGPNGALNSSWANTAYLQEKGISSQYTGKSECIANGLGDYCNDKVKRTTSWTGLVGLMSISDAAYANGWLYNSVYGRSTWTITPGDGYLKYASYVWSAPSKDYGSLSISYADNWMMTDVFPSVYLKSGIKIISGNGDTEPYVLAM